MNVLADVQKWMLEPGINEEEFSHRRKVFLEQYYKLRQKNENGVLGQLSLRTRKKLHPLILAVYTIKNHLGGFQYTMVDDKREKTERFVIYAVTHIGKFDIEVVSEAVKEHFYILSGDFEHIQGIIDEPFLNLNGVLYFNETEKADRKAVTEKMISFLQEGGNLMYFPEGTWNLSPNLPVLPCYWGIVEIARKGNAIIVPVAAEQYGKHFDINVGKNLDMQKYGASQEEKALAIAELRDILATLKWEIWERHPQSRRDILENEWETYQDARFREWTYFSLDYVDTLIYKPKNVTSPREAFAHMDKLIPCKENAFLFRKKR